MNGKRILLLEDDPNLGFMVQENLELRGYGVTRCTNGVDGLSAYRAEHFDLCLVDVMMPKKDGFSFARDVRATDQNIPLIFLTAKAMKEDKIEGFEIGADDYVTKPFSMEELVLRIQAVLKRTTAPMQQNSGQTEFNVGSYQFDYERQLLQRNSKKQKLTTKEAELLKLLCLHLNGTLIREVALKAIWGSDSYFNGRSMDVFISRLRAYLKNDPSVEIINVHGVGYKLVVGNEN
ncbi:MAG TPA: response regulator transcription factor [Bacteroidota bacterium]|jgi:DNA-binding response OmpR family regulator|nr:response regulator transcription factor [Bacteroidota bacterium]